MRVNRQVRRLASLAIVLCGLAPAAHAAELFECTVLTQTIGGRDVRASAAPHIVNVDAFKEIVLFDGMVLGLNRIDRAVISAWGDVPGGVHGEERMALDIDRASGSFAYTVVIEARPQYSRRLQGHCEPAKVEPDF
jgi:hypothetical protein